MNIRKSSEKTRYSNITKLSIALIVPLLKSPFPVASQGAERSQKNIFEIETISYSEVL